MTHHQDSDPIRALIEKDDLVIDPYGLYLCFVQLSWAWFTTQPDLRLQKGGAWHEKAYHKHAEPPVPCIPSGKKPAQAGHTLFKVSFDGHLNTPAQRDIHTTLSANEINLGYAPWLASPDYVADEKKILIPAGTNLTTFIYKVKQAGGSTYLPYGFSL